jgi:hypothetical protein
MYFCTRAPLMLLLYVGVKMTVLQVPLHPRLISAVSQLLDVPADQIMLGQAELWCKIGVAEGADGWASLQNQDQRMHMDYPNHYLTHPAPWHSPDAVTAILYLDDIAGIEGGGTRS